MIQALLLQSDMLRIVESDMPSVVCSISPSRTHLAVTRWAIVCLTRVVETNKLDHCDATS